ncbi:DoxX family protein [Micromonospora echinofusca]|uniref:DoxX family membrane protein n=1 Tax=Micromonospora echinofusca TaxID=47858 RepID=A0ABS3VVF6_MICEH|nr:DoxX family protein [Micromonospora echinofusca]MBO4208537.1 DoxX family membrane protein [Micromonospora echinofusca]
MTELDTALLVLRVGVGILAAGHGAQKLFGWFHGPGLAGAGRFFEGVGYLPGRLLAAAAGLSEIVGGLLMALGLVTSLGATILLGTMLVAISAHWANGLWNTDRGFELPGLYALAAAAMLLAGPGRASFDYALDLPMNQPWFAPAGLIAATTGAAAIIARRAWGRDRPEQGPTRGAVR